MAKPERVEAVKVYLHPKTKRPFIYKGCSFVPPLSEYDPRKELLTFWLEKASYDMAQEKYRKLVEAGHRGVFPQFVLYDPAPRNKKMEDIWDQPGENVGGLGGGGRPEHIIRTFQDLDHGDDTYWNKDGTVSIRQMEKLLGYEITKVELVDLVGDITRVVEDDEADEE